MPLRSQSIFKIKTDLELLDIYLDGRDMDILGLLFERNMELVYGVCLKYFKNRDDSQDAVIGIFEKLVVEVDRHSIQNFRSWLYVLTKNYCLMELRSDSAVKKITVEFKPDKTVFMESAFEMHPIDSDNGVSYKALEDCIKKLKDEQLKCITLFYYENKCYREIAELLVLDEKKVKSHLQNAKRNLKICLDTANE